MKKFIYLVTFALSIALYSCSSDDPMIDGTPTGNGVKTQQVEIKIDNLLGFTGSYEESPTYNRSVSVKDAKIKHLLYILYDENDLLIKGRRTSKADVSPVIHDTLPVGKYRVALIASDYAGDDYTKFFGFGGGKGANFNKCGIQINGAQDGDNVIHADIFYKTFFMEVTAGNNVSINETLDRITSQIQVEPKDIASTPSNLKSFEIGFRSLSFYYFSFKTGMPSNVMDNSAGQIWTTPYIKLTREQLLAVNEENPIRFHGFFTAEEGKDDLAIYGTLNFTNEPSQVVFDKKFKLNPNEKLTIKGKLYENLGSSIGGIGVNNEWGATVTEMFD